MNSPSRRIAPIVVVSLFCVSTVFGIAGMHDEPKEHPNAVGQASSGITKAQVKEYNDRIRAAQAGQATAQKGFDYAKELLALIDNKIAEHQERLRQLQKGGNLSQAMKQAENNADKVAAENAEFAGKEAVEHIANLGRELDPVAEAVGKAKEAKELYDRAKETLSWDMPVYDALNREDQIGVEEKVLEKLQRSREFVVGYQRFMLKLGSAAASRAAMASSALKSASVGTSGGQGSGDGSHGGIAGIRSGSQPSREAPKAEPPHHDADLPSVTAPVRP